MTRLPPRPRGQALVEFALVLPIFLILLMAVFDLGRGIYQYNGVSEAAREIARVTSVHPGSPLGTSAETVAMIAAQKGVIPFLGNPTFACVDIDGSTIPQACVAGMQVKVVIISPYAPVTPLLGLTGTWQMQSSSSVSLQ